eukprot:Pgem_evm1s9535
MYDTETCIKENTKAASANNNNCNEQTPKESEWSQVKVTNKGKIQDVALKNQKFQSTNSFSLLQFEKIDNRNHQAIPIESPSPPHKRFKQTGSKSKSTAINLQELRKTVKEVENCELAKAIQRAKDEEKESESKAIIEKNKDEENKNANTGLSISVVDNIDSEKSQSFPLLDFHDPSIGKCESNYNFCIKNQSNKNNVINMNNEGYPKEETNRSTDSQD